MHIKACLLMSVLAIWSISTYAQAKKPVTKPKSHHSNKTTSGKRTTSTSSPKKQSYPSSQNDSVKKSSSLPKPPALPNQRETELKIIPPDSALLRDKNSLKDSTVGKKSILSFKLQSSLTATLDIGMSSSWAKGDFINYHKAFGEVEEVNTIFKGRIIPIYSIVAGASLRFRPFEQYKKLSNISVLASCSYLKTGFTSELISTYTDPTINYTDKLVYKERYTHNYVTGQLALRYGKKIFVDFGINRFFHIASKKTIQLEHTQEGSNAYQGGFSLKHKDTYVLDESLLVSKKTNVLIGVGFSVFKNGSLRLSEQFSGNTFVSGLNYKNYITQIQLAIPIYHVKLKTN